MSAVSLFSIVERFLYCLAGDGKIFINLIQGCICQGYFQFFIVFTNFFNLFFWKCFKSYNLA